jgi:hypothetical protein
VVDESLDDEPDFEESENEDTMVDVLIDIEVESDSKTSDFEKGLTEEIDFEDVDFDGPCLDLGEVAHEELISESEEELINNPTSQSIPKEPKYESIRLEFDEPKSKLIPDDFLDLDHVDGVDEIQNILRNDMNNLKDMNKEIIISEENLGTDLY